MVTSSQGGGGCPIPVNIEGQVEQGSEQPNLVKDVPAHCRGGSDESRVLPIRSLTAWWKGAAQWTFLADPGT